MHKAIEDSRGSAVSAPDVGALNAFEAALISLVSFREDPLAIINEVIRQWPDFALAHIFKALTLKGLTERRFALAARKSLDAAAPLLADTGTRERQLFNAAQAQLDGFGNRASGIFEELLLANPRDLLSLHLGHSADFTHGDAANLRNRVARVLPAWDPTLPGYAYVLAMHAFGLEECNEYSLAEEVGRKSLELEARNPWAVHAVAHVMEMCGRIDDGIDVTDHDSMPQEGVIKPEDILALVRRQPFKPFRIHMSDGVSYDIRHPELVLVFPRRVVVVIPSDHREGLMQDLHYCAILHITRREELADAG